MEEIQSHVPSCALVLYLINFPVSAMAADLNSPVYLLWPGPNLLPYDGPFFPRRRSGWLG